MKKRREHWSFWFMFDIRGEERASLPPVIIEHSTTINGVKCYPHVKQTIELGAKL